MAETFNKKDKEKKRLEKRKQKAEKMEARKAEGKKTMDDMIAYVDENGNLTDTPPDPKRRKEILAETINVSTPKYVPDAAEAFRTGVISFFDETKMYGFIRDVNTGESIFVHQNNAADRLRMNDKVSFEVERTPKGLSAVAVKKI